MEKTGQFEWDHQKNVENIKKHGISFYVAQFAFADPKRVVLEDLKHSYDERRFYCIGKVEEAIITVRFTYRENRIRLIGAGYWRKGKKVYEEENKI
jgi:hypothetical protein